MLAKRQLDDAISCSLRAIELNRNIPKAERDVEGRRPLRVSVLARAACRAGPAAARAMCPRTGTGGPQSWSAHPPRKLSRQAWLASRASSDRSEATSRKSR
jgi:hypothetical protein